MADISASNWSESDAANSSAAPDGAPEGMAPSGVNDVIRAVMGAVKRWFNWSAPRLTAGTPAAYTLTYGVSPAALVDGMTHLVEFHAGNGAAATLDVNFLGAKPVYYYGAGAWRPLPASLFDANRVVRVAYHAASGAYRLLAFDNRTGVVEAFAGSTVPAGALVCDGSAVSRTGYAALFALFGTTYGAGDGSTTFNLPDLTGRVVAGKESAASRLTSGLGGVDGGTLGASGGAQSNTAHTDVTGTASGSIDGGAAGPPYAHAAQNGGDPVNLLFDGTTITVTGSLAASASGTSDAFSVVQPTIVLTYLIRI